MIKLHLNNFKCWEDKKIEIPLNQTVLLKGNSGRGKTSLVQAIIFALYGNVRKPCKFGKRKCSVKLTYQSQQKITIKRSKGPNHLLVHYMGKKYEDDAAQHVINDLFSNPNLFPYIKQLGKHKLFEGTKNDKLEILKAVSFSNYNIIDGHITKLKNKIYNHKQSLNEVQKKYDQEEYHYNKQLKTISFKFEYYNTFNKEKNEKDLNDILKSLEKLKTEHQKSIIKQEQIKNLKKRIADFQKQIESIKIPSNEELKCYKSKYREYNNILLTTKVRNKSIQDEIKECDIKLLEIEENHLIFDVICDNLELYKSLSATLKRYKLKNLDAIENEILKIKNQLTKLEKQLEEQNKNIKHNEKVHLMNKNIYKCPNCYHPLKLSKSTLIKATDYIEQKEISFIIDKSLEDKIFKLKSKISSLKQVLNEYPVDKNIDYHCVSIHVEYSNLKRKILNLEASLVDSKNYMTQDEYNKIRNECDKYKRLIKKNDENVAVLSVLNKSLKNNKSELELYKSPNKDSEQIDPKEIANKLIEMKSKASKIKKDLENYNKYLYISELKKEHSITESELKSITKKHDNTKLVYNTCIECICVKLENTVNIINKKIEGVLSKIFNDPISIKLRTNRCTKTKKELKFEFVMEIFYKNNEYTSLNELSGGEQSRISIALTIAFNEVANSKFIIFDESLNSLDTEHQNKIIKVLNKSKASAIVISHSATEGLFHSVINI